MSAGKRAQEYRGLAERLRLLSERANLPEAKAELLWLAQSYERLAHEAADGLLMEGHLAQCQPAADGADRAIAD